MRFLIAFSLLFIGSFLHAQEAVNFTYTGEVETYEVPTCVSQLEVVLRGARGGGPNGGGGSTITGILNVEEGQILEIRVGGMGLCPVGGFNGGGIGGEAGSDSNNGCGGGGASDIRIAPYGLEDRVVIAAGGGGMGGGNTDATGGDGGCGDGGGGNSPFGVGGYGATMNAGGNGGPPWIAQGNTGGNGDMGIGGMGAIDPCYDVGPGGGGGGGYYGGGGGGSDCYASGSLGGGGGGGGTSFYPDGFICTPGNISSNGSITITPVEGLEISATPESANICEGDSVLITLSGAVNYSWSPEVLEAVDTNEVWLSVESSTVFTIIGSNANCADTTDVAIAVQPSFEVEQSVELCDGEVYTLPDGSEVNVSGTYPVAFLTESYPCDSIITTELVFLETNEFMEYENICDGDNVELPDGTVVGEAGTYTSSFTSEVNGCDSTIVTEVEIMSSFDMYYDIIACNDGSYALPDGMVPTASGVYGFSYLTAEGCDSLVTLDVVLHSEHYSQYSDEICYGETYTLPDGSSVDSEGMYSSVFQTVNGCDSVITVDLSVNSLPVVDLGIDLTYCASVETVEVSPTPAGGDLSGDLVSGMTLDHSGASPGVYSASYNYTDENGCNTTEAVEYLIPSLIEPEFGFEFLCHDIHLESYNVDASYSYEWSLDDEVFSTMSEFVYTYYEFGDYELGLTITDEWDCEYSTSEPVTLLEDIDLTGFFVPNVITPNQDFSNDKLELPYNFTECVSFTMKIYNKWGTLVYEMTQSTPAFAGRRHDGGLLPEGVYYYTLEVVNYPCFETEELKEWCSGSITVFHD